MPKFKKSNATFWVILGKKNATFLEDFPNYLLGSLEPMCAWKIIRKWLECYLWHIFFQKESRQAADCDCNQKFPEGKKGFEHQKLVVVVGMKAFIRRECRDHPIRDSTQISPTAWKLRGFYDWLAAHCLSRGWEGGLLSLELCPPTRCRECLKKISRLSFEAC